MCPLGSPRRAGSLRSSPRSAPPRTPAFAGVRFTPVPAPPDALVISSVARQIDFGSLASIIAYGVFAVPGRGMFELFGPQYVAAPCADAQIVDVIGYYRFSAWTSCGLFTVPSASEFVATPVRPAGRRAGHRAAEWPRRDVQRGCLLFWVNAGA